MAKSVGRGVREKLRRANIHRQAFERRSKRFLDSQPYTVSRHDDLEAGKRAWVVHVHKRPPLIRWGALIGDCLFDYRSALDHLAFDLAVAYSGTLTPAQEKGSEFPIFHEREPTTAELDRRIGAVHPEARKLIEDMQPHGRRGRAVLGYLDSLHNFDKHRTLHIVVGVSTGIAYAGEMLFEQVNFQPFKDGDVLATAPLEAESDQDPYFPFGIAFSKPSIPDAAMVLGWINTHIRARVIPDLLPYL